MNAVSKFLIISGVILIVAGMVWQISGGKIPLGKLPGDFRFESANTKVYFPLTTSLLISAILSLILYFFRK